MESYGLSTSYSELNNGENKDKNIDDEIRKQKDLYYSIPKRKRKDNSKEKIEWDKKIYNDLYGDRKFGQKWEEYNEAQTREKIVFYRLVNELLNILPNEKYVFGRPRKNLREMLFCCIVKIYTNLSSRRLISELELAKRAGYIKDVPHFNTILKYFEDDLVGTALTYLINISSLPLKSVETKFALDSTGFGAHRFDRYFVAKYGEKTNFDKWRKCHAICGIHTQIVTSVKITGGNVADIKMFEPLVEDTSNLFKLESVLADKAYLSRRNLDFVKKLGGQAYIPFKSNCIGRAKGSPTWASLYRMFTENYFEFAENYLKRQNIESTWSMIKKKFGDYCRCKTERSQDNEILCKILCHNIVVLVFEIFNRKLDINFSACRKYASAHKVRY